jgi:hypothetical protein
MTWQKSWKIWATVYGMFSKLKMLMIQKEKKYSKRLDTKTEAKMSRINLLKETIEDLTINGRVETEVVWVGNEEYRCSWEQFAEVAKDENYDNGFGGANIATDLLVVGKDFWLERHEYDGSEWWEYKELPKMPTQEFKPTTFVGDLRLTQNQSPQEDDNVSDSI